MASLHYKYAAMNSGKSTQLIQAHFNYVERGMRPLALIPEMDDRAGQGIIAARIGLKLEAVAFSIHANLYQMVVKSTVQPDVLIVDEAQFLTRSQVYQLAAVVDKCHIPVIAYGLKTDFKCELFEGAYHLLCLADKVEELKTVCWCGNKAHFNARIDEQGRVLRDGEQIEIGGNERYIALCRKHFLSGQSDADKTN